LDDEIYGVPGDDNYMGAMGWNVLNEVSYIVSPELPEYSSGSTLEFYHRYYSVANTFQWGYSTTDNDVENSFTWSRDISAANTFTLYTTDIPDGVKYIAFKATASAQNACVFVDNIGIYGNDVPAGEWTVLSGVNQPYPLTGLADGRKYEWQVLGNNPACSGEVTDWSESAFFETFSACEVPNELYTEDVTETSAMLNWTGIQDAFNVRYRTAAFDGYYLNENWDGEIGDWQTYYMSENSGLYYMGTDGSVAFTFVYGDYSTQYLFSPDFRPGIGGKTLTFNYKAYSGSYSETFEIAWVCGEETIYEDAMTVSDTLWAEYSVTVPEGAEYMTIMYTSDDGYALILDDFMCYDANDILTEGTWITSEGVNSPLPLNGLTAGTEYEWQVQGVNSSCDGGVTEWSDPDFFFTEFPTTTTQVTPLANGATWFSANVNITLDKLKAALVEAVTGNITIQGQSASCRYIASSNRWTGQLNSNNFDITKMYLIKTVSEGELVLEGEPLVAAETPITILPGSNWITYPLSVSMSLNDAFSGFAKTGDVVKGQTSSARRVSNRWTGQLTALEPGNGYIYVSSADETKTLTFPNPSKATKSGVLDKSSLNLVKPQKKDWNRGQKQAEKVVAPQLYKTRNIEK
jgi:hypothetical protein